MAPHWKINCPQYKNQYVKEKDSIVTRCATYRNFPFGSHNTQPEVTQLRLVEMNPNFVMTNLILFDFSGSALSKTFPHWIQPIILYSFYTVRHFSLFENRRYSVIESLPFHWQQGLCETVVLDIREESRRREQAALTQKESCSKQWIKFPSQPSIATGNRQTMCLSIQPEYGKVGRKSL